MKSKLTSGSRLEDWIDAPAFEALEPRLLLSGNVTAWTAGGSLFAVGDADDNDILIEQGGSPTDFTIKGRTGTTVNVVNPAGVPVPLAGVTGDFFFWMLNGSDIVEVTNAALPRHLAVDSGEGANEVKIDPTTVAGSVAVVNGAGDDTIAMDDVVVAGTSTLLLGPAVLASGTDDDTVDIEQDAVAGSPSAFTGLFYLYGGAGADVVTVGDAGAGHAVTFGYAIFHGGPGIDTFTFANITGPYITI
jgi:hypothetical protein